MAAQGGFGLSLTLNGTVIVGVDSVDEILFRKYIAESTGHDAPGGYYTAVETGKKRIDPYGMAIFWDVNEATHADVLAKFDGVAEVQMSYADPDGDETIEHMAILEQLGRIAAQEDAYRANVLVHPTGTATIT
jgi:hypothetical protein